MAHLIGDVLSERYEIIEEIGTGGMATVYKGKDLLLDRLVAVKVLKKEFSQDEDFVRKFRQESQSAARLSHINIVNVFDVGRTDEWHYIIMELLTGGTLNDLIKGMNGWMSEEALLNLSLQIAMGIEEAHLKNVIHRDIKSQNILLNENGVVKVTDFGIARATTTSTLVNTKEIIGSVHYASPEQARGSFMDERSDIYSLGILMFELVTKKLPFDGDTPVSIALKHIKDPLPNMRKLNPNVSEGICKIVEKATAKLPEERYQSIQEVIDDLKALQQNDQFVPSQVNLSVHETRVLPKVTEETLMAARQEKEAFLVEEVEEEDGTMPKKKNYLNIALTVALAFAVTAMIFMGFAYSSFKSYFDTPLVEVPDFTGYTEEEAVDLIDRLGLVPDTTQRILHEDFPRGYVVDQSHPEGTLLKSGYTLSLIISQGASTYPVPNLSNMTLTRAQVLVSESGHFELEVQYEASELPKDMVIRQSPRSGLMVESGEKITIVVSEGVQEVSYIVPSLLNQTIRQAESTLSQLGMGLGSISYELSDEVEKGNIIDQTHLGENVPRGTRIDIVVSNGPETVEEEEEEEIDQDDQEEASDSNASEGSSGNSGNQEPVLQQRTIDYSINTSQFQQESEIVEIYLIQGSQRKLVYTKDHQKSEGSSIPISIIVEGTGEATLVVYYGSRQAKEWTFSFD